MITFTTFEEDYGESHTRHVEAREIVSVDERIDRPTYGFNQETAMITMRSGDKFKVYDGGRMTFKKVANAKANELQAEHVAMHHPACERKEGCCI